MAAPYAKPALRQVESRQVESIPSEKKKLAGKMPPTTLLAAV
jgi:hypothetical protein